MTNESIKQTVERHYDSRVRSFSDTELATKETRMRPLYEKLAEWAHIDATRTVAVVGSSTGALPIFLAAHAKGVLGVDFSQESLRFAEWRTAELGLPNISYRRGDAEALPLDDQSVDVVVSDCVINLTPDKRKALSEIFRVLRGGGVFVMADPVRTRPLAEQEMSADLVVGCIAGTVSCEAYQDWLRAVGFEGVSVSDITALARSVWPEHQGQLDRYGLRYVLITATKPALVRDPDATKEIVRQRYSEIAQAGSICGCSSPLVGVDVAAYSQRIGYTTEETAGVPDGANLGLGCGNPVALASLREGEVVLDLGSGAGFDAFLAAQAVGERGKVIGVDMTPEMVSKAVENAARTPYRNVEFRLGDIENLPVQDSSVDVVISNCVINLVPEKERAFKEALRVLKPGGRLMVSDLVLEKPLPAAIKEDVEAYIGCIGGALVEVDYLEAVRRAGFEQLHVVSGTAWSIDDEELDERIQKSELGQRLLDKLDGDVVALADARRSVKSIKVSAFKPTAS